MKTFRRVISSVLVLLMLMSAFTVGAFAEESTLPFTDVADTRWSYPYIETLYNAGIVNGTGDGTTFSPTNNISRAEFVKMLGGIEGIDASVWTTTQFTDVKSGSWYEGYVAWAVYFGITNGTGDGTTFSPTDNITRQDMSTMIYRYADKSGIKLEAVNEAITFSDNASISSYAADAVKTMQQAGIINGIDNGDGTFSFDAKGKATREVSAKMLCVLYDIAENGEPDLNGAYTALKAWVDENASEETMFLDYYPSYTLEVENANNPVTGAPYTADYYIFYDMDYDEIGIVVTYNEPSSNYYVEFTLFLNKTGTDYFVGFMDRYTVQAGSNLEGRLYLKPDEFAKTGSLKFEQVYGDYEADAEYIAAMEEVAANFVDVVSTYTDLLVFANIPGFGMRDFGL